MRSEQKTIYIGKDEPIVGERGPKPKCVADFFPGTGPAIVEDLHVLNTRELQRYTISQEDIDTYEREVIPYWKGRTQRETYLQPCASGVGRRPMRWGMFLPNLWNNVPGTYRALDGKVACTDYWI